MAAVGDLYQILRRLPDATQEDIKRAYRQLRAAAPPRCERRTPPPSSASRRSRRAYEILSDPQKRQRYDTFGAAGGPGAAGQPFADIQDIFRHVLRRRRRRRVRDLEPPRSRPGRAAARAVERRGSPQALLAFPEAAFGARRELRIDAPRGVRPVSRQRRRARHRAHRVVARAAAPGGRAMRRSIFGTIVTASPCRTCGEPARRSSTGARPAAGRGRATAPGHRDGGYPPGVADGLEPSVTGAGHAGRRRAVRRPVRRRARGARRCRVKTPWPGPVHDLDVC